jgi:hypothetical protein
MNADPLAQVRIDLRNAARIQLANGLMQGNYFDHDQVYTDGIPASQARVCGLGAINIAITGEPAPTGRFNDPQLNAASEHVRRYLAAFYGDTVITDYNDAPGRTAAQVALLLRKAASWTPPQPATAVTA